MQCDRCSAESVHRATIQRPADRLCWPHPHSDSQSLVDLFCRVDNGSPEGRPLRLTSGHFESLRGRSRPARARAVPPLGHRYLGLTSTFSNISTICSAIDTCAVSPSAAALLSSLDVLPRVPRARLFRQMADQRPHVGERDQIHDGRDCQRAWQGARPVGAGQGGS